MCWNDTKDLRSLELFFPYVSSWVYMNDDKEANECLLHRLKICGVNHHIISMIALNLNTRLAATEVK